MDDYISCSQCGRQFPYDFDRPDSVPYIYHNNRVWCSDCVDRAREDGRLIACDACGADMEAEDAIRVEGSSQFNYICEDCFNSSGEEDFFECFGCHNIYARGEHYLGDLDLEPARPICDNCMDNGVVHYCSSCDTIIDRHHSYCSLHDSSSGQEGRVYSYQEAHHIQYPPDHFCLAEGESPLHTRCCGFELEYVDDRFINLTPQEKYDLDNYDIDASCNKLLKAFRDNDLLKYASVTKDATVTGEVITVPMSIEWLYSTEGWAIFQKLLGVMEDNDCKADLSIENRVFDTDSNEDVPFRVGGHIHVSSLCNGDPLPWGGWLANFVNFTKTFWKAVAGRSPWDEAYDYCKFWAAPPFIIGLDCLAVHGFAVNLQHLGTIELRFWGGCLTAEYLRARAVISCALVEFFATVCHKDVWSQDTDVVLKPFLSYLKEEYPHGEDGYRYFITLGKHKTGRNTLGFPRELLLAE